MTNERWSMDFMSDQPYSGCAIRIMTLVDNYSRESLSVDDTHEKINAWREQYNCERPHSSLGNLTPEEFARRVFSADPAVRAAQVQWPVR